MNRDASAIQAISAVVIVGLTFLLLVLIVTLLGFPIHTQLRRVLFLSWYWHFVDAVWVIVFTVVYIIGR